MSTHCKIGMLVIGTNKIKSIYCHFDGYLDGVGKILVEHYTTPKKVESLLNLGPISSLGENPDLQTIAFSRDLGETDVEFRMDTFKDYLKSKTVEYIYLFSPITNEWRYTQPNDKRMKSFNDMYRVDMCVLHFI